MTTFRFIHSSDLHLGKRFARYPAEITGRLAEARHAALGNLAEAARGAGAKHVLVAGDVFDTETPSPGVLSQALAAMADDSGIDWWLIPGNHDSLAAEALWDRIFAGAPPNVHVLSSNEPVEVASGVWLLPAPLPRRRPGIDLTEAMDNASTPQGALRIGLAHGPVTQFSEEGEGGDMVIAPDRAVRAGLDYLGLGDWHGQMRIGERTWYSGTPEFTDFRHSGRGACLSVSLAPGQPPEVAPVEIGQFAWRATELALLPGEGPAGALEALLPVPRSARRNHLMKIVATGRASLAEQAALTAAVRLAEPEFGHFELVTDQLATEFDLADLDAIDRAGALRVAAERLAAHAADETQSAKVRKTAEAALNRLYSYLQEEGAE
ncbi:metallophosphoesterase family protein [Sinisalibacter lacisalsi]|uniref:Exonuclease n=1 Tax=Sinisalibacter lacisalsi TaxID=1526570 RepID=A0ABQ1QJQ1_9RHOB|nr:DNA repair exonuclease [Sinisalibacter lacisalsi]GGD28841.1 exonuclease [Sinisalibacter lacisalsi]